MKLVEKRFEECQEYLPKEDFAFLSGVLDIIRKDSVEDTTLLCFSDEGVFLAPVILCKYKEDYEYTFLESDLPTSFPRLASVYLAEFLETFGKPVCLAGLNRGYVDKDKEWSKYFYFSPSTILDMTGIDSLGSYLTKVKSKYRGEFSKIIRLNSDLVVVSGAVAPPDLVEEYKRMWQEVKGENIDRKIDLDLFVCDQAADSVNLGFYLDGKLVAVNRAIIEEDTLYDVICVRATGYASRSLGTFAVLKNIEHVLGRVRYYDLQAEPFYGKEDGKHLVYKNKFKMGDVFEVGSICSAQTKSADVLPPYYDLGMKQWFF